MRAFASISFAVVLGSAQLSACAPVSSDVHAEAAAAPPKGRATSISANWKSTCAVMSDGTVRCWGDDCRGAHPDGVFNLVCSWPKTLPNVTDVVEFEVGALLDPDCMRKRDGSVYCGSARRDEGFTQIALPGPAKKIANAGSFACALLDAGELRCWGTRPGATQAVDISNQRTPVTMTGLSGITDITGRSDRACAIAAGGKVTCFDRFQSVKEAPKESDVKGVAAIALGIEHGYIKVEVTPNSLPFVVPSVRGEGGHACAITDSAVVHCWGGSNSRGELGIGKVCEHGCDTSFASTGEIGMPEELPTPVISLALGLEHSCALGANGRAYCWGNNYVGQVGDKAPREPVTKPTPVKAPRLTALACGNNHTCGLTDAGDVWCWGANEDGELGRGSRTPPSAEPKEAEF